VRGSNWDVTLNGQKGQGPEKENKEILIAV